MRACVLALLVACGGGAGAPDAAEVAIDATDCVPLDNGIECGNCVDDDRDGAIDGWDPECTGGYDDDEGSFQVGIPDQCESTPHIEDCAHDGNSGAGDDGCVHHACCALVECPEWAAADFDPAACAPSAQCEASCAPLTHAGCDCFGCCTMCDGATCRDVFVLGCLSPDCDYESTDDPEVCLSCTKAETCQTPCGGDTCILCPGQISADLPAACGGVAACPAGQDACNSVDDCGPSAHCATGCCVPHPD